MADRSWRPLEAYGLIGDRRTAALVADDGSIDWACLPRFDSPALFARLMDRRRGGFWQIAPVSSEHLSTMRYVNDTAVIETIHQSATGTVRVSDLMLIPEAGHGSGILRVCEALAGRVELESTFEPRFDYGSHAPRLEPLDATRLRVVGPSVVLYLHSSIEQMRPRVRFELEAGQRVLFILSMDPQAGLQGAPDAARSTEQWWRAWCRGCHYEGPYAQHVTRSAITLELLTYAPSGAIVAAPTTSLPEHVGGTRNWDYRFAWLRDASLMLDALLRTGQRREGYRFLDWVCSRVCELPPDEVGRLGLVYAVDGGPVPAERVLEHLAGYRGSRPVRIGNAAAGQVQLDIYGEVIECFSMCLGGGRDDIAALWPWFARLADWVAEHWRRPDHGIWEVRGGKRHFVYSKAMAWVALDRAVRISERTGLRGRPRKWRRQADAIRRAILDEGWSERLGAFKQSFEDDVPDASNLLLPLVGVLEPSDPRAIGNLDRVRRDLTVEGLVYRYREAPDGIGGPEASFGICAFWLVSALCAAGRLDDATDVFERMLGRASPLGLYSEEIDPATGALLGNYPQGFTHAGLIAAALDLDRALAGEAVAAHGVSPATRWRPP